MSPGYHAFVLLIVLVVMYSSLHAGQAKLEKRIAALEKRAETAPGTEKESP